MSKLHNTFAAILLTCLFCVVLSGCSTANEEHYNGTLTTIASSETLKELGGWSPDGNWLVYVESVGEGFRISKINIKTEEVVSLLQNPKISGKAVWSPKADLIAYCLAGDIWTMGADGSNQVQITSSGELSGYIAWDSTGESLYVLNVTTSSNDWSISQVDVRTKEIKEVIQESYPVMFGLGRPRSGGGILAWAFNPKGCWLYEIDLAKESIDSVIYQPVGLNRKDGETWLLDPDPSPDGNYIVYQEGMLSQGGIWLVKADGSAQTCLLSNEEILDGGNNLGASGPVWSPNYEVIAFTIMQFDPEKTNSGISLFRFDEASLAKLRS